MRVMNFNKYNMATKTHNQTPNEKKRKQASSSDSTAESDDEISLGTSFDRFFVIEPTVEGQLLTKLSPFVIAKFLQCRIGNPQAARKLQSGSILVEVASKAQATNIANLDVFVDVPVKVSAHRTLNSSRGVIRCRDLRDCMDDEVLTELKPQGVTYVKHILSSRNGMKEPTNTFILTFNSPTLPQAIKVGYLRVPVERYIPNPLRCFQCQRYGHGKTSCRRTVVCARCGQEGHEDNSCSSPHHCANCAGDHPAYSRNCSQWHHQAAITRIKFENNITFREAEALVRKQNPMAGAPAPTYASRVTTGKSPYSISVSCQTDYTWPLFSAAPVLLQDSALDSHHASGQESIAVQTEQAVASQSVQPSVTAAVPAKVLLAQTGGAVSAKPTPPGRLNPRNQRENPSKTNGSRRVSPGGTLQKGPQVTVVTGNTYGALAEMDVGVPDDQEFLLDTRAQPTVKNSQTNKQTNSVKNG